MSTTKSTAERITLYDIAQRPPVETSCCAPNPWKARFALNFKRVPYATTWVGMLDIGRVRRSLGASACRKFADGGDFYTLPVVQDPATGAVVGDSFDIAAYLEEKYPESGEGSLFPEAEVLNGYVFEPTVDFPTLLTLPRDGRHPHYGRFNLAVDTLFTTFAALVAGGMPLDPATADEVTAEFARRAGVEPGGEEFTLEGEARQATMKGFEAALGGLAKLYGNGPFVLGKQVSYADFIVGAWLRLYVVTLPREEWEQLRGWHGGVFGRLHDALEEYAQIQ